MTMSLVGGAGYYYSFIIVGKRDNPLFEIEFAGPKVRRFYINSLSNQINIIKCNKWQRSDLSMCEQKEVSQQPEAQFVIHAALDLVEEHVWKNPQMYAFPPPLLRPACSG
jgi:hypothetical protein